MGRDTVHKEREIYIYTFIWEMYGCTNLGVKSMEKWGNRKKIGNKVEHKYEGKYMATCNFMGNICTNIWELYGEHA